MKRSLRIPSSRWLALLCTALLCTSSNAQSPFEIQGHRGARGLRPENTLSAFDYAMSIGVDTLELDLAVTKDNVLVVSHDPLVNATICTGADGRDPAPNTAIHSLSLKEIKTFDCGAKRNPNFPAQQPMPGERIPTLQEVFDLVKARGSLVRFNIETKVTPDWEARGVTPSPQVFVTLLLEALTRNGLVARASIQSFDFRSLQLAQQQRPELSRVALVTAARDVNDPLRIMRESGANLFSPNFTSLTLETVKTAQQAGYHVIPWTVDLEPDLRRLMQWGVDGIISDDPALAIRIAKELGKR